MLAAACQLIFVVWCGMVCVCVCVCMCVFVRSCLHVWGLGEIPGKEEDLRTEKKRVGLFPADYFYEMA